MGRTGARAGVDASCILFRGLALGRMDWKGGEAARNDLRRVCGEECSSYREPELWRQEDADFTLLLLWECLSIGKSFWLGLHESS
jgi:hypothetical protein